MKQTLMSTYKESASSTLEQATCLPLAVYHDPSVFDAEMRGVFLNDWVFACAETTLVNAGDYFALDIAGEPIAIIRGQDTELRALSNICRHRGTPLLDLGFGQIAKNIVCPYHAWTFDDTGAFKGAPLTGDININKQTHCLPSFAVASWYGLVFVNLSDSPCSFSEKVEGLSDYLSLFELERFSHAYQMPAEHWNSNWKLAVENGIESYHLFKVHKETLETTTPSKQAYYVAGNAEWSLTGGAIKDDRGALRKWLSSSYPEAYNHYLLLFLPPSLIAVVTYEGLNWIQVLPEGPEHCSIIPGGLSEHPVKDFKSSGFQFTEAFLKEDRVICEWVQRGIHSRKSKGGKLVSLEKILVDFHQYLANRLFQSVTDEFIETEQAVRFYRE
jgi:phenylpropionate dioxygenase-like ring-hydroxylating dioxygenase large terminal subunit